MNHNKSIQMQNANPNSSNTQNTEKTQSDKIATDDLMASAVSAAFAEFANSVEPDPLIDQNDKLKVEIAELEAKINQKDAEIEDLKAEVDGLKYDEYCKSEEIAKKDAEITELKANSAKKDAEIERGQSEINELYAKCMELQRFEAEVLKLKKENESLSQIVDAQNDKYLNEITALGKERDSLNADIEVLRADSDTLHTTYDTLYDETETLRTDNEKSHDEIFDLRAEIDTLRAEIDILREENRAVTAQRDLYAEENGDLRNDVDFLTVEANYLRCETDSLRTEFTEQRIELNLEVDNLEKIIEDRDKKYSVLCKENQRLNAKNTGLHNNLNARLRIQKKNTADVQIMYNDLGRDYKKLQNDYTKLQNDYTKLHNRLNAKLRIQKKSFSDDKYILSTRLAARDNEFNNLRTEFDNLYSTYQQQKSVVEALQSALISSGMKFIELKKECTDKQEAIDTLVSDLADARSDINYLNFSLNEVDAENKYLASCITEAKSKVEFYQNEIDSLVTDIDFHKANADFHRGRVREISHELHAARTFIQRHYSQPPQPIPIRGNNAVPGMMCGFKRRNL